MATSLIAKQEGEIYQARMFWLEAYNLFQPQTSVRSVGFEFGEVKSFDDVVVRYEPPVPDTRGGMTSVDYIQLKYHKAMNGSTTWKSLMDPAFIGAESESLLKKLHRAQKQSAPDGTGCRFILRQPWREHPDDELAELINNANGSLNLIKLAEGKTDRSKMGQVRKAYREHLGIDDEELFRVLMPLRLQSWPDDLSSLRRRLNGLFTVVGLRPIGDRQSVFPYDDLVWSLFRERAELMFTRETLETELRREGLYVGLPSSPPKAKRLGVRSFMRLAENLEHTTDAMICLTEHFDGRLVRHPSLWPERIWPGLRQFLEEQARGGDTCHVVLESHGTLAFASGYALNRARGEVFPAQGQTVWRPQTQQVKMSEPLWTYRHETVGESSDTAVALNVTHDVMTDVHAFLNRGGHAIGHLIECTVLPAPGQKAVQNADHAFALAQDLVRHLRFSRGNLPKGSRFHFFVAAPNFLLFMLGKQGLVLGPVQLYEFDPTQGVAGDYHPALKLP